MSRFKPVLLGLVVVLMVSACAAPAVTSTPKPLPTQAPPATSVPPSSGSTAGQLADLGKPIYARSCARCHGDTGQGLTASALIGAGANLGKYGNAQELLTYISKSMPRSAPGSLKPDEYLQVMCFLLFEDKWVQADAVIDPAKLADIILKK